MDLIQQLREEHVTLLHLFEGVKADISKGGDLIVDLRELKLALVNHLKLEDRMLYPVLAKSKDAKARSIGNKYLL
ncbi:hypothetical protein CL614_03160 [archaeon]|nr:hypothetical protein [archaeon]|tara:strand:+ start:1097 stop:1321 length:225 start_codon:yes stop_codon:yes gene_type:complete